jgi:hypothetical protein
MYKILQKIIGYTNDIRGYDFYIGGPMRGYDNLNYPLFNRVAKLMRNMGLRIYNPAEHEGGLVFGTNEQTFAYCMHRDLHAVKDLCNGIALLPGWRDSLGANAEVFVAFVCGKRVAEIIVDDNDSVKLVDIDASSYRLPYKDGATNSFNPHKCALDSFGTDH